MNVGQTELAALMAISESLVINAEQMHQRRLKIVNVDAVFGHVHAQIIGCTIADAAFDTGAGHPDRKRVGMMVPSPSRSIVQVALNERCPAKFAAPNDQCVFEQTSLLQIP